MKDKFRFTIPACLFAAGCIGSSIYCFFIRNMDNNKTKQLELLLNDEQIKIYYRIVEERRNIFIASKVIGLILAYLFIKYQKLNGWCKYCIFIVIVKMITCISYMMIPKSDYFLNHIETKEQSAAWIDVYVEMKYNLLFGFVLGMLGYSILIYAFQL